MKGKNSAQENEINIENLFQNLDFIKTIVDCLKPQNEKKETKEEPVKPKDGGVKIFIRVNIYPERKSIFQKAREFFRKKKRYA